MKERKTSQNVSNKITELRKKENLNQVEFARKYNLKDNAIGFMEKGTQEVSDDLALSLEAGIQNPLQVVENRARNGFI